ncbi:glutamine amidotransferase [Amycolatopsis sp. K13G38]|uniref:Lipid II isoglutaminyl synthase (glutamine-hydrolyzing) subunit GatD n=1 Tax=Amycolatopsis acididurans TaxID=2724524 RepID=A0ABX1JD57_9PSEU|nr:glutamine amidotransferase [Amycolatopsis acididurans]NKQ57394.1 glutamine amidotransferase [Amycolatopsis acididurans]
MRDSVVQIGLVLPDVLGTYSDAGNATVLRKRLEWRGIDAETVPIGLRDPMPSSLDLYLLGGGEDEAQALAAARLRETNGIQQAAERGAVVLGVCAGLQVLGGSFTTSHGVRHAGLGLLDTDTRPGDRRAVGEVAARSEVLDEPLTGFENHQGVTTVGEGSKPLGTVVKGTGNGDGTEGAVTGHVLATYLHGPVLARNPALADLLLSWALDTELSPLDLPEVTELRRERLRLLRCKA